MIILQIFASGLHHWVVTLEHWFGISCRGDRGSMRHRKPGINQLTQKQPQQHPSWHLSVVQSKPCSKDEVPIWTSLAHVPSTVIPGKTSVSTSVNEHAAPVAVWSRAVPWPTLSLERSPASWQLYILSRRCREARCKPPRHDRSDLTQFLGVIKSYMSEVGKLASLPS